MTISQQLILLFSAFGGLNGLLLAVYLFINKLPHNRWLCALVLVLSIRTLKSVFFYFNPDITKHILQLGLSACLLIGPICYCYIRSFVNSSPYAKYHVIAPLTLIAIVGVVFPYTNYPQLWGTVIYKAINYIWLAYLIAGGIKLYSSSPTSQTVFNIPVRNWLTGIIASNAVIWSAFFFASYTSYISGALIFTTLLLLSVLVSVNYMKTQRLNSAPKYHNKQFDNELANEMIAQLKTYVEQERVFLNSTLTMPQLAKKLSWSSPQLSQLINDNLQKSFVQFINEYRIEHAKQLLLEDNLKTEDIAFNSGYNSLSTFYSAFKKQTGLTPAQYRKQAKCIN